jgi:hypothetical protein
MGGVHREPLGVLLGEVVKSPHPVSPFWSAAYHGVLAGYLLLGVIVHSISWYFHWQDWKEERRDKR